MSSRILILLLMVWPAGAAVRCAGLAVDNQDNPLAVQSRAPRLSWMLEATDAAERGLRQTAYQILVASSEKLLEADRGDVWDSGRVSSSATIRIPYAGKAPASMAAYFWKVRVWDQDGNVSAWSPAARWRMGLLRTEDWKAQWIAAPAGDAPLPIFRRAFRVNRPVAAAIAYVSGLGQYELRINGRKAGDSVLAPGWTNYRKTVFYNAYDITAALRPGDNAIGILLGNGMYHVAGTPGRYTKFTGSFGPLKAIARIHLVFGDGTTEDIVTDAAWKTRAGPIVFTSIYGGEDYDARLEPAGWDQPGFDDREWAQATTATGPGGELVAQESPDLKVMRVYPPVKVTEPKPGVRVYDLGQNFSGWPQVTVRGRAGAAVKLVPGELLDASGLVTQRSSGGPQWFRYTLKGGASETWHPRFSYYGFRYVQVEVEGDAEVIDVEGQFVHSSAPQTGEFTCSDELLNRTHALIVAAIRSNMQSVLTDCPHREKLGWLEESHLLGSAIMYNFDVSRLYRKIAGDIRDAQGTDGMVPDIAPEYTVFEGGFRDSPEWGSAAVLDPWLEWRHYGDRDNLAAHYGEMKKYAEYLGTKAAGGMIAYGLGDWYDIGPGSPGRSKLTGLGLTATAIYYADLVTLRRTAEVLGLREDRERFAAQAEATRAAFNARLFDSATGVYDRGSQTAYAMPLALGLAPEERRAGLLDALVADIRRHGNHTTAGDIGFHFVLQALSEGGRPDVIYDMLTSTEAPSYGDQLRRGATSLTEAWDADPNSSQNHFMLGHAEEWFYRRLAGIDFDLSRPEKERIILRPYIPEKSGAARASYRSVLGVVTSDWRKEGGRLILEVEVPVNSTALVYVPARRGEAVAESGRAAAGAPGVRFVRQEDEAMVCEVGSGRYRFERERRR